MQQRKTLEVTDISYTAPHKAQHALELLAAYSETGRELYDFLKTHNKLIIEKDLEKGNYGNECSHGIEINSSNTVIDNIFTLAHEAMHAVQRQYGLPPFLRAFPSPPLTDALAFFHAQERGAVACHIRCLYEMNLNGYKDPWNVAKQDNKTQNALTVNFEQEFNRHINQNPDDLSTALDKATLRVFNDYLKHAFIPNYNVTYFSLLSSFLANNLNRGTSAKSSKVLPLSTSLQARHIIQNARLPSGKSIIGIPENIPFGNDHATLFKAPKSLLRDAFEYLELLFHVQRNGAHSPKVKSYRDTIILDNPDNVFMNGSSHTFLSAVLEAGLYANAYEILCDLMGVIPQRQSQIDFRDKDYKQPAARPSPKPF